MDVSARAAFFDVDETVIRVKSMFDFLRFWLTCRGDDGSVYAATMSEIHALAAQGVDRSEINRAYYRRYASISYDALLDAGRDWYAAYRQDPDAFIGATRDALARHSAAGDAVVLVSGSFRACLQPLAADVGADLILCTDPVVDAVGVLTGDVVSPMIGPAKGTAVSAAIAHFGFAAAECFCYGDHLSDLSMLSVVGHPHVVDSDPALVAHARMRGWPVLPAGSMPSRVQS